MFWNKLSELCRKNGISVNGLCKELGFSNATATHWKQGATPNNSTLKKLSEYFGVPVDYFTSDNSVNVQTVQDNHGIIGNAHAPVTIYNGNERKLSSQASKLLDIFESLDVIEQAELLVYAKNLSKK